MTEWNFTQHSREVISCFHFVEKEDIFKCLTFLLVFEYFQLCTCSQPYRVICDICVVLALCYSLCWNGLFQIWLINLLFTLYIEWGRYGKCMWSITQMIQWTMLAWWVTLALAQRATSLVASLARRRPELKSSGSHIHTTSVWKWIRWIAMWPSRTRIHRHLIWIWTTEWKIIYHGHVGMYTLQGSIPNESYNIDGI